VRSGAAVSPRRRVLVVVEVHAEQDAGDLHREDAEDDVCGQDGDGGEGEADDLQQDLRLVQDFIVHY
jgi:hypothetical protein